MASKNLFRTEDGKNHAVTFFLVASLFLLWGFCNGMIDTMDKHFQMQLHLSLAQSAWVQFAHYMGYAIMALPAGMLTRKVGYKGGIIFGLLLVATGGFWFMPATRIAEFWAFLLGVCAIAMGLTVLETVANPYTTILGPKEYGPTRINLAQSFNGVGWILGPIIGGTFFYSKAGVEAAEGQIYIPYLGVAIIVLILAVLFFFARVPDVQVKDEYHTDDTNVETRVKPSHPGVIFAFMCLNVLAVALSAGLVAATILPALGVSESTVRIIVIVVSVAALLSIPKLGSAARRTTENSIWAHPHFSGATVAQFVYVAAQAGIFSYFINTMTPNGKSGFTIVPVIPPSWPATMDHVAASLSHALGSTPVLWRFPGWLTGWFVQDPQGHFHISDSGAADLSSVAFVFFLAGRLIGSWLLKKQSAHRVLGTFCVLNVGACALVMANLGWVSVLCVFLSYFFMSIGFPTIFALGIHGLGTQAKKRASAFIVMSITGGALMPKIMGHLGDLHNMAFAFLMPLCCFILIAIYAYNWSRLSHSEAATVSAAGGH